MQRAPAILVVFLTLFASLFLFVYWVPATVDEQSALIFKSEKIAALTPPTLEKDQELTADLAKYIAEKRAAVKRSLTDNLDYEGLLEKAKDFEDEAPDLGFYGRGALRDRFRDFETGNLRGPNADSGFEVPPGLEDTVKFWVHVFGVYDKNHVIFYNKDDVSIVYSVLDFSDLAEMNPQSAAGIMNQMVKQESVRLAQVLEKVARHVDDKDEEEISTKLSPEEARILVLLRKNGDHIGIKSSELKTSLTQRPGFAHRMRQAIAASGAYMPEMRRIFEERGLPMELTVLPFIESAFSVKAYSSASAAGLWQFIPATGRNYLRIDQYVDERYDPILATYAAASHLAREFKLFNDWPLTINGYNTGPGRMQQAVRELKTTDIALISKYFRGAGYGFDSRNYYPEFLAALEIYENRETYFGDIAEAAPEAYDYLTMPIATNLKRLFRSAGVSESLMAALNPGLKPEVIAGLKDLPKGYLLKVPPERKDDVLLAAEEIYQDQRYASYHVVTKGEKLTDIALQYGIEPVALATANGLIAGDKLRAGDILKLPVFEETETDFSIVRPGEEKIDGDRIQVDRIVE